MVKKIFYSLLSLFVALSFSSESLAFNDGPRIEDTSFGHKYKNCFSGSTFFIKTDDNNSDTLLQIFESLNGENYFTYKLSLKPIGKKDQWYEFQCPESSNESVFQIRLANNKHAGNSVLLPYSSGPMPTVTDVDYMSGIVKISGNNLDGKMDVYYEGTFRGSIYGTQTSIVIPESIHQRMPGLYVLKNAHGKSDSFLVRPYAKASFSFVNSPQLHHSVELRNNCKNIYASAPQWQIDSSQGICSVQSAYSYWGLVSTTNEINYSDNPFIETQTSNNSITAISPSGYGSRVELDVAVDAYQLAYYGKYYREAVTYGEVKKAANGFVSLSTIHYVPFYKAIYLGEANLIMDARTSIAAHVVLDVLNLDIKPELIGQLYKAALSSPVMTDAANRYNQLLSESIVVDYGGPTAIHHIASPLYIGDARLDGFVTNIAQSINSNGIKEY